MPRFKSNKAAPSPQKARGGYYTPRVLADCLCRWAIRNPSEKVLEPSCGDGSFLDAAGRMLDEHGQITAVELVPEEIQRAQQRMNGAPVQLDWRCASFFDVLPDLLAGPAYDVVVGNPPFIRFQYFDKDERARAFGFARSFGYRPNGLANAWVTFVQLSAELLRDGGRMAMVVPAELLQVQYAAELRYRLPMLFDDVCIVAFDRLVFPEIQQEIVLLLAEGRRRYAGRTGRLHTKQVADLGALRKDLALEDAVSHLPTRQTCDDMKWTSLFLEEAEFGVLRGSAECSSLKRLGSLASVDVGLVTGRNSFFVVAEQDAQELRAGPQLQDIVGRTSALKSIRFTDTDYLDYAKSHPSKLLDLSGSPRRSFSKELDAYIRQGEADSVHTGYKCRIRERWFDVPSVYVPDALLYRQIHKMPLLVANLAGVTSTDTIHRVRVRPDVDVDHLCAAMVNSLTCAWAELAGRSYGGGVLELEPREAEALWVPFEFAAELDADYLDGCLRDGDADAALAHGDAILLRRGCGLSERDIELVRSARRRLMERRQRRGKRRTASASA